MEIDYGRWRLVDAYTCDMKQVRRKDGVPGYCDSSVLKLTTLSSTIGSILGLDRE